VCALFDPCVPLCRPIIGILSMPNDVTGFESSQSYFPASYVKWLEAAGARVVPLPFTASADETRAMLTNINGALFTGGGSDFTNPDGSLTPFAQTAQIIFNESTTAWASGESFPLWGTCQGHELISFLASNADMSILTSGFDSENLTIPLNFTAAAPVSRLYGPMPPNVIDIFASQPVTMNNHQMGVAPADFAAMQPLASRFTVLATNLDRQGRPFVSSMEGQGGLPIFTTQYHPEKVQFECECDVRRTPVISPDSCVCVRQAAKTACGVGDILLQRDVGGREFALPQQQQLQVLPEVCATPFTSCDVQRGTRA